MTIQDLLQDFVNDYAANNWGDDHCKPEFTVSLLVGSLIITCSHNGSTFSEYVFPEKHTTYGLSSIEDICQGLYNRTM